MLCCVTAVDPSMMYLVIILSQVWWDGGKLVNSVGIILYNNKALLF